MPDIFEYVREKFDGLADRILELLTGSKVYRVGEMKERVPDIRRTLAARLSKRLPPPGVGRCDWY
jgi:hypothetical protein